MQMAANVEFQQMRDQYLRKQQMSMGINNPNQATTLGNVSIGNVMQSQPPPSSQQMPNALSQQQQQQMAAQLHRQQQQRAIQQRAIQYQQMMHPSQLNQQQKSAFNGQNGNGG